jgi:hypothetical protein
MAQPLLKAGVHCTSKLSHLMAHAVVTVTKPASWKAGTCCTSKLPCLVAQAAVKPQKPVKLKARTPYTLTPPHPVTQPMATVTQQVKPKAGTCGTTPVTLKVGAGSGHRLQADLPHTSNPPCLVTPQAVTTLPTRMKAGTPRTMKQPCFKAHVPGTRHNKEGQAPTTRPPWRGTGHTMVSVPTGGEGV